MHQSMHHICIHYMHHMVCHIFYCALTLFNAVCPWFCVLCFVFIFLSILRARVGKTRAKKNTTSSSFSDFERSRFQFKSNQETYEKLNIFKSVWAERKVILDEVNPEIRRNFESRGWLPLLDVEHPPSTALIREFYSSLAIHSNDSNIHYVRTWIRGEEFVITHEVMATTLNTFGTAAYVSVYRVSSH